MTEDEGGNKIAREPRKARVQNAVGRLLVSAAPLQQTALHFGRRVTLLRRRRLRAALSLHVPGIQMASASARPEAPPAQRWGAAAAGERAPVGEQSQVPRRFPGGGAGSRAAAGGRRPLRSGGACFARLSDSFLDAPAPQGPQPLFEVALK